MSSTTNRLQSCYQLLERINKVNHGYGTLQKIDMDDKYLVDGYLREQQSELFVDEYFSLQSVRDVILMYSAKPPPKQVINVKVAIVGDSHVGKTTLIIKYIHNIFDEELMETQGLNVMEKSFELKNCTANLPIYDLGGDQQFTTLLSTALDGAKAVIFAFNLVQKQSLISVKRRYKHARKLNKIFKPILVGTKYDLFEKRDDSYKLDMCKLARNYAQNMHSPFIMCSAKIFTHVQQVVTVVVASVFQIKMKSKSKQKHNELDEPILEYDVIYKKRKRKKRKKKHAEDDEKEGD